MIWSIAGIKVTAVTETARDPALTDNRITGKVMARSPGAYTRARTRTPVGEPDAQPRKILH